MTSLLKLGIAVASLIGVAVLIAVDAMRNRTPEAAAPAAPTHVVTPLPPAFTPPVAAAPKQTETPVICPTVPVETPAAAKKVEPAPVEAPKAPKMYTVLQGDSLYSISVRVYGTPRHYQRIYELNRDYIKDPNTLQIGINLRLPDVPVSTGSKESAEPAPTTGAVGQ